MATLPSEETDSSVNEANNETLLLQLAKENLDGISNEDIKEIIPDISIEQLAVLINKCLKNG